jgi:hypothetical protein
MRKAFCTQKLSSSLRRDKYLRGGLVQNERLKETIKTIGA